MSEVLCYRRPCLHEVTYYEHRAGSLENKLVAVAIFMSYYISTMVYQTIIFNNYYKVKLRAHRNNILAIFFVKNKRWGCTKWIDTQHVKYKHSFFLFATFIKNFFCHTTLLLSHKGPTVQMTGSQYEGSFRNVMSPLYPTEANEPQIILH